MGHGFSEKICRVLDGNRCPGLFADGTWLQRPWVGGHFSAGDGWLFFEESLSGVVPFRGSQGQLN